MNFNARLKVMSLMALALFAGSAAAQDLYQIDKAHTGVVFKVKHLNTAFVYGRFNDIGGTVNFNPATPEKGSIDITIMAESIDTNQAKRDQHLKSPDFFNAKQFPVITFKSTAIARTEGGYAVSGDMFINGVTRKITVPFTITGQHDDGKGTKRIGGEAEFTIRRSEYNIKYMPDGLSEDVRVFVSIEAMKK
jgi:polyisoprenoid-binding protein YceI